MLPFMTNAALKNFEAKSFEDIESYCRQCIDAAENDMVRQEQLDRAVNNYDFYRGAQWTEAEHDAYTEAGVTPLTINRCRPQVKSLLGLYASNRQEVKIIPRRGGTEVSANVYTELMRHTHDQTNGDFVFMESFRKGSIETESWLHFDKNKSRNAGGQLEFFALAIGDVFPDPGCRCYDINQEGSPARYMIHRIWKSVEELELLYPEHVEKFQSNEDFTRNYISRLADSLLGRYGADDGQEYFRLPVRYIWWRQARRSVVLSDKQKRIIKVLSNEKQINKAIRRAKQSNRFEVIPFVDYVLHKSTVVCDTLVDDEENPFGEGFNKLPFARFSPFYDSGFAAGMLDDIVSLNKEENINRTQATRYLNQLVNSGWIVGDDSDTKAIRKLQQYGSVNGVILGLNKYGGSLDKIKPNPLPQGHIFTAERAGQDIKEVTGLNDDVLGYDKGRSESGRAINLRQKQGIQSNEPLFQNFYFTLQLFGQMVFDAIRTSEVYTDFEIREIVKESSLLSQKNLMEAEQRLTNRIGGGLPKPAELQPPSPEVFGMIPLSQKPQVYDQIEAGITASRLYASQYPELRQTFDDVIKEYAVNLLLDELKSETLAEYGVKVITSPMAPSVRMANFAEIDSVIDKFAVLPPELLEIYVDATDLPNKEEIKLKVREVQSRQAAMQQPMTPKPPALPDKAVA